MGIPVKIISLLAISIVPSSVLFKNIDNGSFFEAAPTPTVQPSPLIESVDSKELFCLAQNVYFEARNESVEGWKAVAHVTLNRKNSERFPDTICDVVYQSKQDRHGNPLRNRCQFSWYCDGKPDGIKNPTKFDEIVTVSRDVLLGNETDNTRGATYYHAIYVNPGWSGLRRVRQIGLHIFYKEV
jgi:spore germination cell wall hydrolase CwlJ-like protein